MTSLGAVLHGRHRVPRPRAGPAGPTHRACSASGSEGGMSASTRPRRDRPAELRAPWRPTASRPGAAARRASSIGLLSGPGRREDGSAITAARDKWFRYAPRVIYCASAARPAVGSLISDGASRQACGCARTRVEPSTNRALERGGRARCLPAAARVRDPGAAPSPAPRSRRWSPRSASTCCWPSA